ncbi:SDR family oxidoreductase [Mycobacterium sp. CVI_P3]|uniref:SDR family oxidoreductase n=1 Tax=Mycobacterium pinniadriaticum TaxID=2994102 RepID=A0ABT3SBX0_9MYCO|nr:SDR family oxidoreductase [Mycobacterium pinniadriaticum]MCX2930600.1 SDR family oxidoreductase [Mycobacterium pinniadriaticum]MCX2937024.1 SDR family oxidoreductase [Mycobacterium pinniadriaticum]
MDLGLKDKVALVLGATQGMGRATAMRLAAEGTHLVLCSRGHDTGDGDYDYTAKPELEAVAGDARTAGAASALAVPADLTENGQAEKLISTVESEHGRLDVLVNTVGLCELGQSVTESDEVWDRSYQSVLMTSVRACRAGVPLMLRSGRGAIVTTSAMSIRHFIPRLAHYSAQKAALAHFTKNLAREYGPMGIRANAVLPGMIVNEQIAEKRRQWMAETGGSEDEYFAEANARWHQATWGTRLGVPDDIASAITFLVSERASYVNGVLFNVDGGSEYL